MCSVSPVWELWPRIDQAIHHVLSVGHSYPMCSFRKVSGTDKVPFLSQCISTLSNFFFFFRAQSNYKDMFPKSISVKTWDLSEDQLFEMAPAQLSKAFSHLLGLVICHLHKNVLKPQWFLIKSWPLISLFFVISGFQRHGGPASRWQFPHRAFGLDALDLGDMWGWPFDIDFVIISIYSLHWVMAFIIFCGLCYFLLI